MDLLERDQVLQQLRAARDQAFEAAGRVALISGEAGIGKTSLVEHFAAAHPEEVLWGACESLFTPRPLGPLYDIAHASGNGLLTLLDAGAPRASIFSSFFARLKDADEPCVLVIEDAHWADEATLDLLKFLGRRIQQTQALLVLTYREEEVHREHPLRLVLGDLPHRHVTRLPLRPLSERAVAALAQGVGRDPVEVFALTGGNPFLVTEVLASEDGVPATVRDAVLARALRLSKAARAVVEAASVVPGRAEQWVLHELLRPDPAAVAECLESGMLRIERDTFVFRHELSRRAVEETLPVPQRKQLHSDIFTALSQRGDGKIPLARLAYHADQAGRSDSVLRLAPEAARQAADLGAHRAAAVHYRSALRHAGTLASADRGALLEQYSYECYLTAQMEEAQVACEEALEIWRALGDRQREGNALRSLSRISWYSGEHEQANQFAQSAVEVLEALPPSPALARAYSNISQQYMVASRTKEAQVWGRKALALAEQIGQVDVVIHALNNIGTAQLCENDDAGWAPLERSLQLALEHDLQYDAARAHANLADAARANRLYRKAIPYFADALSYCKEHELDTTSLCLLGERGLLRVHLGEWSDAADDAREVLARKWLPEVDRLMPLLVLGLVRARRGDPGSEEALNEAARIAQKTRELQRISPVTAARAEAAWLRGELKEMVGELREAYAASQNLCHTWYTGELAIWLWRAGALESVPEYTAQPYAHQIAGNWRAAADAWEERSAPYEQALALFDGDEEARMKALKILMRLGATATEALVRRVLRDDGVRGLPRGPRPATRANPAGLTRRQMDVMKLLTEDLTNTEIAARLYVSPKTVEHHVAAILVKVGAQHRGEAAELAVKRGWVS